MIKGKTGGSGAYSYREHHSTNSSVLVAHMPEDGFHVRIVFRHQGEITIPTLKLGETEAILLWQSLDTVAKDLKWDGEMK